MKPDATRHDPRPEYIRGLINQSGLTQSAAARAVGISLRVLQAYISAPDSPAHRDCPYAVQFALESLAGKWGYVWQRRPDSHSRK